jgi:beta-phosphoglucomutase-like phosphatase (HAD superfamily)
MPERAKEKPKAVVWDLDGTLSDDRARAHYVEVREGRARDWESYFDAIDQDPPIAASMEVLRALHAQGLRIVFLTGRPEYTRRKTERWLKANGLTDYDRLLMRPPGDFRRAGEMKVEQIEKLRKQYELVCAFEDRIDVADALRVAGLPVFLYGAGAEAAAEALEVLDASQDALAERRERREEREKRGEGEAERPASRSSPRKPASGRKSDARTTRSAASAKKKAGPAKKAAERGKARAAKAGAGKKRAAGAGSGGGKKRKEE